MVDWCFWCFVESCMRNTTDVFLPAASVIENGPQCKVYNAPRSSHYRYVNSLVRQWTLNGYQFTLEDIGRALLGNATYLLVGGSPSLSN